MPALKAVRKSLRETAVKTYKLIFMAYIFHVVNNVENAITIDRQGRLVLPSHIREALGLKEGGQVSVRLIGSRVILEPISKDLKERVQEWATFAISVKAEAFTEEPKESWKWMSREYAKRKLGLS